MPPSGYTKAEWVEKVRIFIGDSPIKNKIQDGYELTDGSLLLAIDMTIDEYNTTPPNIGTVSYTTYPSLKAMMFGAMLHALTMAGIVQTRNFIQFQDGRLGTVISDKAQGYQSWIGTIAGQYAQLVADIKYAKNAEDAFGHISSPYDGQRWSGNV